MSLDGEGRLNTSIYGFNILANSINEEVQSGSNFIFSPSYQSRKHITKAIEKCIKLH